MPDAETLRQNYASIQAEFGLEAPYGLPNEPVRAAGLNIWARSEPKAPVFDHFARLAMGLGVDLHVYVDDVCAQLVTARTPEAQSVMNDAYREYFAGREIPASFSSELLGRLSIEETLAISSNLLVRDFARAILPEKKQREDILLSELSHAVVQLAFLEEIAQRETLLLSGRFSQGVLNTANGIIPGFPYVITARQVADGKRAIAP